LVKLLVVEDGSDLAAELWNRPESVATSILAYPEGRAALAAARRSARLTKAAHARALAEFEELSSELISIGVDEALVRRAGRLAEELGLRGYDAVHLASALELGEGGVVMVSWDTDLQRAAGRVGLAVGGG